MRQMPKGRPTTLRERNNVECPGCGSILTRCRGGGRSDHGDLRLRKRICDECRFMFVTAEVPLLYPDGTPVSLSALDIGYRRMQRRVRHRQVAYYGTKMGRKPILRSAQPHITVRIVPPRRAVGPGPFPESMPQPDEDYVRPFGEEVA